MLIRTVTSASKDGLVTINDHPIEVKEFGHEGAPAAPPAACATAFAHARARGARRSARLGRGAPGVRHRAGRQHVLGAHGLVAAAEPQLVLVLAGAEIEAPDAE